MSLPFSPDQFFEVFAAYNRALWPAVIALWLYALLGAAVLVRSKRSGRFIAVMLTVHWAWTAVAYHFLFFSRITPGAWLFGGLFLVQSALFAWFGIVGNELRFSARGSTRHLAAWTMIVYSLAYPFIVQAEGHELFHAPWFGVPCPTTLMTIGFLFAADPPWPRMVALIPLVWSIIAGSAALLLGVRTDLMLWVAAISLGSYALRSEGFRTVSSFGGRKSQFAGEDSTLAGNGGARCP